MRLPKSGFLVRQQTDDDLKLYIIVKKRRKDGETNLKALFILGVCFNSLSRPVYKVGIPRAGKRLTPTSLSANLGRVYILSNQHFLNKDLTFVYWSETATAFESIYVDQKGMRWTRGMIECLVI